MGGKKIFTRELWVGFLGILALLIIYVLINFFKGVSIVDDESSYYVRFSNIGEIVTSSPVFIDGYKVGNVRNIQYDFKNGSGVIVELDLDKRLKIPAGSYAEVNTGLLGSSTISIIKGNGEGFFSVGDTLFGKLHSGAMDEAANMVPKVNDILPKVDSLLVSMNTILKNPAITKSIDNIESLTAELNKTTVQLNKVLNNDVAVAAGKLIKLEDEMIAVAGKLNEIEYQKLVSSLEASLNNIEQATAALNNGEGTAGMLLKDSTLYVRLNNTCDAATALLEDLKNNPKRYVHFSLFGKKEKKEDKGGTK